MLDPDTLDWKKMDGLLPAVVQHAFDGRILMVGYMDREALARTVEDGRITFFSRSQGGLWMKGETTGNVLELVSLSADCDADCLLVLARPRGPTCHRGTATCFDGGEANTPRLAFLSNLERVIRERETEADEGSYTAHLLRSGTRRIAQKVGEEGVETAIAASAGDDAELLDEAADLVYHLLVLLRSRGLDLERLVATLEDRHR